MIYTASSPSISHGSQWSESVAGGVTYERNVPGDSSWLELNFGLSLPSNWVIDGAVVRMSAGVARPGDATPVPVVGQPRTSLQAVMAIGSGAIVLANAERQDVPLYVGAVAFGSSTDRWGIGLDVTTLNNSNFRVFVSRPNQPDEDVSLLRYATAFTLEIYYHINGGTMSVDGTRMTVNQLNFAGVESTRGTASSNYKKLKSMKIEPKPAQDVKNIDSVGSKLLSGTLLQTDSATIPVEGQPTYDEMVLFLSTIFGAPVSATVPGGTLATRHVLTINPLAKDAVNTLSVIWGDSTRAHRVLYAQGDGFTLQVTRKDATFSGSGFARQIEDSTALPTASNEVQTLTMSGNPTGGTYRLKFLGHETTDLAYNANAATVQSALNALASIGSGGVAVSGSGPMTVTFNGGSLAGVNQPLIELSNNSLTGGTSPTLTNSHTTRGGWSEFAAIPISAGDFKVYVASTYETLSAGLLTGVAKVTPKLSGKAKPRWEVGNGSSIAGLTEGEAMFEIDLEVEAKASNMALLAALRSRQRQYFRLAADASAAGLYIEAGSPYSMDLNGPFDVGPMSDLTDVDGVYGLKCTLKAIYDPATGRVPVWSFVNGVASY